MAGGQNKKSKEEIEYIINNLGYKLLNEYFIGQNRKVQRKVVIQDNNGYKYDVELHNLINEGNPYLARTSNPFSLGNISIWLKLNNKNW